MREISSQTIDATEQAKNEIKQQLQVKIVELMKANFKIKQIIDSNHFLLLSQADYLKSGF